MQEGKRKPNEANKRTKNIEERGNADSGVK